MVTCIKSDDTITINSMCLQGYTAISVPRKDKQGGGIALVHCNTHKVKCNFTPSMTIQQWNMQTLN